MVRSLILILLCLVSIDTHAELRPWPRIGPVFDALRERLRPKRRTTGSVRRAADRPGLPITASPVPEQRGGLAVSELAQLLHSAQGAELCVELLREARRAVKGQELALFRESPAEVQRSFSALAPVLLGEVKRLKRSRYTKGALDRWNRQKVDNRAPAAVLNLLAPLFVIPDRNEARSPWFEASKTRQLQGGRGNYGLALESFLGRLMDLGPAKPDPGSLERVNWWMVMSGLNERASRALAHAPSLVAGLEMPGLDWTVQTFGRLPRSCRGALVRAPMRTNTLAALLKSGFDPKSTVLYDDKDHFLDPRVAVAAQSAGFTVTGADTKGDRANIERWIRKNVASLTTAELQRQKPVFFIYDDGAYLIEQAARIIAADPRLKPFAPYFTAVEQTGSGTNRLTALEEQGKLPFRVVGIPRGTAKGRYGPPIFGYAVVSQALERRAELERHGVKLGKTALVMGIGTMGQSIANYLQRAGYRVLVWDVSAQRLDAVAQSLGWNEHGFLNEIWNSNENSFTPGIQRAGSHLPARQRVGGRSMDQVAARLEKRDGKEIDSRHQGVPLDVLRQADLVFTATAGNPALGLEELIQLGQGPGPGKQQMWINTGSPGEIEKGLLSRAVRSPSTRVLGRREGQWGAGMIVGELQGKRIPLGYRGSGPDVDSLLKYGKWEVLNVRQGRVVNGYTAVTGNRAFVSPEQRRRYNPTESTMSYSYLDGSGSLVPKTGKRKLHTDDATAPRDIQLELSLLHAATIQAFEGGAGGLQSLDTERFERPILTETQRLWSAMDRGTVDPLEVDHPVPHTLPPLGAKTRQDFFLPPHLRQRQRP